MGLADERRSGGYTRAGRQMKSKPNDAVLDNWQSSIEITPAMSASLRSRIGSVAPGQVMQNLEKYRPRGSRRLSFSHNRSVISCQKRGWHRDPPILNSFILVIINDAHVVQGHPSSIPEFQGPGAVLHMNLSQAHRCSCTASRSSGKLWVGLAIDTMTMREDIECDRAHLELAFRHELEEITRILKGQRKWISPVSPTP